MAPQRKALRDWLYLFIISIQLFGMLGKPSLKPQTPFST